MRHRPQGTKEEWLERVMSIKDINLRCLCGMCVWHDRAPEDYDPYWYKWYLMFAHHYRVKQNISMKRFKKALGKIGYKNPEKRVPKYRRFGKYA